MGKFELEFENRDQSEEIKQRKEHDITNWIEYINKWEQGIKNAELKNCVIPIKMNKNGIIIEKVF